MIKHFLILISALCFSLNLWSQNSLSERTDFTVERVSIAEAIWTLAEENDLEIAFSDQFFEKNKQISLRLQRSTIKLVLEKILARTNVGYKWQNNQIILFKKVKKTISGYVIDKESGEKMAYASVYAPQSGEGVSTNEHGFFSIILPVTTEHIEVSYTGYQTQNYPLSKADKQGLYIKLSPSVTLTEIIVTPQLNHAPSLSKKISSHKIMPSTFETVPTLGGEPDLIRTLELLPGVQMGTDGLAGLNVRGGSSDQNLMLLDGVPVYNSGHLLNLFSIYNTSTVKSAQLIKSAFPARYGGRLSSVLDVRTREGNNQKISGEVGLGLVSAKATLEVPLVKGKGSILLSGRRTHLNTWLTPLVSDTFIGIETETNETRYNFYDFNIKANYEINKNNHLFLSYYQGDDLFGGIFDFEDIQYERAINWGNSIASLRWNHVFSDKLFSNTRLTYSEYQFSYEDLTEFFLEEEEDEDIVFLYIGQLSNIQDISGNIDFDYRYTPKQQFRFGAELIAHTFNPNSIGVTELDEVDQDLEDFDETDGFETIKATEVNLYTENNWEINNYFSLHTGLRLSVFNNTNRIFPNIEPRLELLFNLNKKQQFSASISRMVQYLHRIKENNNSLPNFIWFPAFSEIPPQRSWQANLGFSSIINDNWQWSSEVYFKKLNNLIISSNLFSINFDDDDDDDDDIEDFETSQNVLGNGTAYGLEVLLEKTGQTGGWLSYSLAKANRSDNLQNYAFQYDARHQIKFFLYHQFNQKWSFSTNWIFNSPSPILQVLNNSYPSSYASNIELPSTTERGKAYHRLDFNLTFKIRTPKFLHQFNVGAFNVYGRENTAFTQLIPYFTEESETVQFFQEPVSLIGFMPSLRYDWKF